MASNLQDGDYDQRGDADTKSEPPYQVRSQMFKEHFSLADQLTSQVTHFLHKSQLVREYCKVYYILLTEVCDALNDVALSYHSVRGLYFLAVIIASTITKLIQYNRKQ